MMTEASEEMPTATKVLKAEIARFLSVEEPEVLCLRGKWGVGKTFGWNAFYSEARESKKVALKRYAYVSLFGVQSLDELKYSIFENTLGVGGSDGEPSIEELSKRTAGVIEKYGRQFGSLVVSYIPGLKNASDTLKVLSFLTVTKQLICIDDIERKGKNLRTQDILGLVSFLKEHRKCKVILILNEEELDEDDKKQLAKFQEKVIDSTLLFAPTPEECAAIALTNQTESIKLLASRAIALRISNIRVIKKIERLVQRIEPMLANFDPQVLVQAVQTLVLFGCAHYSRTADDDSAFIEFIVSKRGQGFYGSDLDKELTEQERVWDNLLERYGYASTDEFDAELLVGIRNGFFDEEGIRIYAQALHDRHIASKSSQSLESAWRLYHDSFDDNEEEMLEAIGTAFSTHIKFVDPPNLEATVRLLKQLNLPEAAQNAIDFFMQERADEPRSFWADENRAYRNRLEEPDVRSAFDAKLATFENTLDPTEVLLRIGEKNAWSNRDIELLNSMTKDDYKKLFHSLRGADLRTVIITALDFERISNRGTQYDPLLQSVKAALTDISKESDINKLRVSRWVGGRLPTSTASPVEAPKNSSEQA